MPNSLQETTAIYLDIGEPGVVIVPAKQYDTLRNVRAYLFDHGTRWEVPSSNFVAVVGYKKSDRIGGFYDQTESGMQAVSVNSQDRSVIDIKIDRNMLTTPGNVSTEITFYDSISSGRLSTFSFIVNVEAAALSELDLSSNPYFQILADDITAVLQARDSMTGLTASATTLNPGSSASATVSGGTGTDDPYHIAFGIPKGTTGNTGPAPAPSSTVYEYANSTSGTTPPSSGWGSSTAPQSGKYYWCKATTTWNNDSNKKSIVYSVGYIGANGTGSTASEITCSSNLSVQEELNYKILVIDEAAFSSLPKTISNASITSEHVVLSATLGTPSAQVGDWTVSTSNGSVTISGSVTGSTTLRLVLGRPS